MTTHSPKPQHSQSGFARLWLFLGLIVGVSVLVFFNVGDGKVAAASTMIKSGVNGYCLDDYKNSTVAGNKVVLWGCNDSAAQNWSVDGDKIVHNTDCLSVQADDKAANTSVIAKNCTSSPGQVWLQNGKGLFNPNSSMCLAAPGLHKQVVILPCSSPSPNRTWTVSSLTDNRNDGSAACPEAEGERVA